MTAGRWPRLKLGKLVDVKGGKRLPAGAVFSKVPTNHPYIRGQDIRNGRIRIGEPLFVTEEVFQKIRRYTVDAGDVCITIVGNIGDVGITPVELAGANLTENAVKLIPLVQDLERSYLAYALLSPNVQEQMKLSAAGAAQPKLGIYKVNEIEVPVPDPESQRRIVSILSAYDDLIENNTRRIAILEEMARRIYDEWFVRFRFPGHENVRMVESELGLVPEGWSIEAVEDVFETIGGGTPSKAEPDYWVDGVINWYVPTDLTGAKTVFMEESAAKINALGLSKSSAKLFPANSVMMTSRATIGAIAVNTTDACTNQGFISCLPSERFPLWLLFHWLKANVGVFESLGTGATFKEITKGVFRKIELAVPEASIVDAFEKAVGPMMALVLSLERKNRNLRTTRDLLLPKLISGELDVSAMPEPELAA
ncbi:MAG TPA: restriction endonuclease subunit S [Gammaproteobacteria bacterium]|nr:restriction endonuclease subunit S [Gammaproteobacteria bacterium]